MQVSPQLQGGESSPEEKKKATTHLEEDIITTTSSLTTSSSDSPSRGSRKRARAAAEAGSSSSRDPGFVCPYLDTIDRASLDFDFEKLCSVSLTNLNVYGCLVCGKYFHGRAKGTPAFNHSLGSGHHIFINLDTSNVYCLPDLYEVKDPSLADIKYNLNPTYTQAQIQTLTRVPKKCRGLDGHEFRPGYIGLNNLKCTDYLSAVVQSLAHIPELLTHFMSPQQPTDDSHTHHHHQQQQLKKKAATTALKVTPLLSLRFGELLRKMWSARAFKGQVSPHELMQAITLLSKKKFQIGQVGDPVELMQFLLNGLHAEDVLCRRLKSSSDGASIIHQCFQGRVFMTSQKVKITQDASGNKVETIEGAPVDSEVPFMYLQFSLPDTPLFKEESERNIIPQVPLFTLLQKYNGEQTTVVAIRGQVEYANKIKYVVKRLPKYLIFYYKRFSMNYWFEEKNKTIVNFPLKSLDMRDFVSAEEARRVRSTKYDLVANVCHDGPSREKGVYNVHILNKTTGEWYQMQDLDVKDAVPQEISCSAPYLQIWEAQDAATSASSMPPPPNPPPNL